MKKNPLLLFLVLFWLFAHSFYPYTASVGSFSEQVQKFIRNRIETASFPAQLKAGEEVLFASVALPRFYEQRVYRPAWVDDTGPLSRAEALVRAIHGARNEGLHPEDYHLRKMESLFRQWSDLRKTENLQKARVLADLELLLTDAFLIYGSHLVSGKVNPENIDSEWIASRREVDTAQLLEKAIQSNEIAETLTSLLPEHAGYGRLKTALSRYREIETGGGWPVVPEDSKLQKGDRNDRVTALRVRLLVTGDLESDNKIESDVFDDELEGAVRRFQKRHGLDSDGVVGPKSLDALNASPSERVKQIESNLERWRWLPQDLGARHILLNIANYMLDIMEDGVQVLTMRAIIGKEYRKTPVFSASMIYLVLSPFWHIPPKIAIQDKLPLIKKDVTYLEKQKIRVFQRWGAEAREIDPRTVDWENVTAKNFEYRLRQDPGPLNALGQVKFMFPNKFNVYIHDTPSRELFVRDERAFSSGCVRVEKPIDLAVYLLRENPKWKRENILAAIDTGLEQTVALPNPILVHLLYWTAWVDEDGTVQFRKDIYARDQKLWESLNEESPKLFETQKRGAACDWE
ncbi:MAG: L,D-transpeptidase family protein [Candidatus Aminicenantes bacterium]|jgi:murein L,D-transpeptidase YcbB/YkuD